MTNSSILMSRRAFAGAGLVSAGVALAPGARAVAQIRETQESPMGPYYPLTHPADADADLTWLKGHSKRATGVVIEVSGRVLDLQGNPIGGAMLEVWQANAVGRYAHPSDTRNTAPVDPNFQGYASIRADSRGRWRIVTIKPGAYDFPLGTRTPHIHWDVRGKTSRTLAQMYFPEEAERNAVDFMYKLVGPGAATSVVVRDPSNPNRYTWDIVLAG